MAMILAGAALLTFFHDEQANQVSRAIYEATFESVLEGNRTMDLGGHTGTHEFTDEVIRHVKTKLEVWSALA
jgi:isocitrate/isopropylmalate dehydrogenase